MNVRPESGSLAPCMSFTVFWIMDFFLRAALGRSVALITVRRTYNENLLPRFGPKHSCAQVQKKWDSYHNHIRY